MKYLFLFLIFCFQLNFAFAREELLVIQTVSNDLKSFVIGKGIKDGISEGQELIFANENVSLVCKAIAVNRDFSYWKPLNQNMNVPFLREEIVSANSHIYGSIALDLTSAQNKLLEKLEVKPENKNEFEDYLKNNHYALRGSIGAGFNQNSSSVTADQNPRSYVFDLSFEYDVRTKPELEIGFGLRYDNDVYRLTNPTLDIPTTRILGIVAATYHFINWSPNKNNIYVSILAGLGTSSTVVNQAKNTGYATVLPQVRLGYLVPFTNSSALLFEGSVESISAKETLPNGTIQTSSSANAKGTIGFTF
jgi:hypothetical protein